jgi:hypothetical protein
MQDPEKLSLRGKLQSGHRTQLVHLRDSFPSLVPNGVEKYNGYRDFNKVIGNYGPTS